MLSPSTTHSNTNTSNIAECNNDNFNNNKKEDCFYQNGAEVIDYLNFDSFFTIEMNILFLFIFYILTTWGTYYYLKKSVNKNMGNSYQELNKKNKKNSTKDINLDTTDTLIIMENLEEDIIVTEV